SKVPVYLYNVPSRTVANLEPETAGELSQVENIEGLKDATGDMQVLQKLQKCVKNNFVLLSGDDASSVEFCSRGGHGVISVSSHIIGKEMREAIGARDAQGFSRRYAELFKWLYIEANPIAVKMAMYWMGVIDSHELRLP